MQNNILENEAGLVKFCSPLAHFYPTINLIDADTDLEVLLDSERGIPLKLDLETLVGKAPGLTPFCSGLEAKLKDLPPEERSLFVFCTNVLAYVEEMVAHCKIAVTPFAHMLRWMEALSNLEAVKLVESARVECKRDENFHLHLPLNKNNGRDIPKETRKSIENLNRAVKCMKDAGESFALIVETLMLKEIYEISGEVEDRKGGINLLRYFADVRKNEMEKMFCGERLKDITPEFESFGELYSLFERAVSNLSQVRLPGSGSNSQRSIQEDVDFMVEKLNLDNRQIRLIICLAYHVILSPKMDIKFSTTITDSVYHFTYLLTKIEANFRAFLRLGDRESPLSSYSEFLEFMKSQGCEFVELEDSHHYEIERALREGIKSIQSQSDFFEHVRAHILPWEKQDREKLQEDFKNLSTQNSRFVFLSPDNLISYFYLGPFASIIRTPETGVVKINRYSKPRKEDIKTYLHITYLKYFLLNPKHYKCNIWSYEGCDHCLLAGGNGRPDKDCVNSNLLKDLRIKFTE